LTNHETTEISEYGSVRIADEVVATIAGLAAIEIPGVAGMSGGIAGDITEMLGKKNLSKGVKVKIEENEAFIDLYMIMDYGIKIHEVAREAQEKVKMSIENMTGLKVKFVNIHIQGVKFGEEQVIQEEGEEQEEESF